MEESKDNNVKATIDAVTGLAKAVPVYQDAVQPAAKEIGKSLATVTKTVNIALSPIKALVWGYEKIEAFLSKRVAEKLKDVPEEKIETPPPNIAGPAVEALRFAGDDQNLRELYASLIAMSMNTEVRDKAHPSFVEVIKNLSTNDALVLNVLVNRTMFPLIDVQEQVDGEGSIVNRVHNFTLFHRMINNIDVNVIPVCLDNLARLGLIEIIKDSFFTDKSEYVPLESDDALIDILKSIEDKGKKVKFKKGIIRVTSFGSDFVQNVVAMD